MTSRVCDVVAALGDAIAQRIGAPRYNLWFAKNTKFTWTDDLLTVGVPNLFFQEWLEKSFAGEVKESAREILGQPMQVRFAIDAELFQTARKTQEATGEVPPAEQLRDNPSDKTPEKPKRTKTLKTTNKSSSSPLESFSKTSRTPTKESPPSNPSWPLPDTTTF